jgi:structural maintenance of chromosome 3 (chondroitin sulfate proteoglycan 6)
MGKEERQALLHEGTGPAVMSAYVELIFDNSDDRLRTGKPEVILRRTIGIKKDEYTLDRKSATKSDVLDILESAGFSRSNPYYIVPQGRVTALTNMKDTERLTLLKEVAGTQVYENRRAESLKIMTDASNNRSKIDELLKYINERLAELEEEKEELRDYEDKNKERRCLQYTIDHREQMAINQELEILEGQREEGTDEVNDSRNQFIQGEGELAEIESNVNRLKQEAELLQVEKSQLDMERKEAAKEKAKIELELNSLNEGQAMAQQARAQYQRDLKATEASIQQRENELAQIMPEFIARQEREEQIKAELDSSEAKRQQLYAKQGRNSRFRNKAERDNYLRREIEESRSQLTKIQAVRKQTADEISQLEQQIEAQETEIQTLKDAFDQRGEASGNLESQLQAKKAEKDKIFDERQELWREDARLDSILSNTEKELRQAERELSYRMDSNTSRGLAAVRRIKEQQKLNGVYGTVAELMDVSEKYRTAVEVTAGNSLFHYIVDNEQTATIVLETLQKERSGRVTFMPLSQLRPRPVNVPKASDAVPMIEKLNFEPQYEKAFQQVFGKTIVCPNLTIASQYARSHGVSAITLEGDRSDRKGALSGGYHDKRQSRLQAVKNVTKWRQEYQELRQKSQEVKRAVEQKHQEVTKILGELQKLEQIRQKQESSYLPLRQQIQSRNANLLNRKDELDAKKRTMNNIESNIKIVTDQQNALEQEMSTDFKKALTTEEEQLLEGLTTSIQNLRKQHSQAAASKSELEDRKTTLEIELRESLRPRLEQLRSRAYDNEDSASSSLAKSQEELKRINKIIKKVETKLQSLSNSISTGTKEIAQLEEQRAEIRSKQEEIAKYIERQQKRSEKNMQKKALLTKQLAEVNARIRDLGVLPQEAFAKFQKMKSEVIVTRLRKVNEALKKYSHVNKKAFQQYEQFTNQREALTKRREELNSSHSSIEELITTLDQRKDEAIERTFKQVSKEFAKVFETLVPAGRGRLIIQTRTGRNQVEEDSDEDRDDSVENYIGVGISVSFNSKHDDQQRIQQLSGGQKSKFCLGLFITPSHKF